jgi:NadR type nicotinamide-nucleotide adenylyltransferase
MVSGDVLTKQFRCGLVVGKFSPLHRGHEWVIRRALDECDEVVVISYSNPEFPGSEASARVRWLAELFPKAKRLVLGADGTVAPGHAALHGSGASPELADERTEELSEPGRSTGRNLHVPSNDVPDDVQREFVAALLREMRVDVDAVFTSEAYGDGFAAHLTERLRREDASRPAVAHVMVDAARQAVPISGTKIRADVHAHREWLSPVVYASFVRRVCLLGGESSGKSVLARALAERLETQFVPEYGRDLWTRKKGVLEFDDLLDIATTQIALENAAARQANAVTFCDTSPLTTLFYSVDMFGRADPALERLAERSYDLYVLCAPDFPFVQDGTRRGEDFRQRQHDWYVRELTKRGQYFVLATGPLDARVDQIARLARSLTAATAASPARSASPAAKSPTSV